MEEVWAQSEMAGADVWDRRCVRSLTLICERLAAHPGEAFSAACGSDGRQAGYRIFDHESTTVAGLLRGHVQQTAQRCHEYPLVLAIQDTTEFDFSHHPATKNLGPLRDAHTQGLLAHGVLATSPEGLPLGLLHVAVWRRPPDSGEKKHRRRRTTGEKESQKWIDGLRAVEAALPAEQPVLVIADREGDVFAYLATERRERTDLLIRACQARSVQIPTGPEGGAGERQSLLAVARGAPVVGRMRVTVSRQAGKAEREAELEVRAMGVEVQPPRHAKAGEPRRPQAVSILCAREIAPPSGEKAIEWILVMTVVVTDGTQACEMVRFYARRWRIERLHYTLKSGCQVEQSQMDDGDRIHKALGVYYVVAWRLLWLTYVGRTEPEKPAEEVLPSEALVVLEQAGKQAVRTAQEVVRAIARLGGFINSASAGDPGAKVMWRGWRRLEAMVAGWRLAVATLSPMIQE